MTGSKIKMYTSFKDRYSLNVAMDSRLNMQGFPYIQELVRIFGWELIYRRYIIPTATDKSGELIRQLFGGKT